MMIRIVLAILLGALVLSCSPAPTACTSESGVVGTGITLDVVDLEAPTESVC